MPFIGQLEPDALLRQFLACPPRGFTAERLAGGIPAFTARFDVLTTAEPAFRRRVEAWPLHRHWRDWLRIRTRFVGSTVSEYACFPGDADPARLAGMLHATQARSCPLLVVKDIPGDSPLLDADGNAWARAFAASCAGLGFVLLEGQALAWAPIDFESTDGYLARLSRSRRRDIRRKLRSRALLDVEVLQAGDAFRDDRLVDDIHALYCNVHAQSQTQFDFLERDFFAALLRDEGCGGVLFVYRRNGRMIGWNLCFEYAGMLVDKYMGLLYPQAREYDLYAVSWFENLEYARRRGLRAYVAGWTDPQAKAQLGARFTSTWHAVYPRNRLLRWLLRRIARRFEGDRAWREASLRDASAGA